MELQIIFKALLSLGVVFTIMFVILKIMQRCGSVSIGKKIFTKDQVLKIENILYIDDSTKVVNIRHESGSNYVVFVGKNNAFLLDKYMMNKIEN